MKGKRADLQNLPDVPGKAGASTAFAFLTHFVPESALYMHIDIAGRIDSDMSGTDGTAKGLPQAGGVWFLIESLRAR